jgi:CheY-like chemotaxis protein
MAKRILIVDDDPDLVESIGIILRGNGYETDSARNSQEAVERIQAKRPDLILLDIMMRTQAEGVWFSEKLRSDPALKGIPILVVSGVNRAPGVEFKPLDPERDAEYFPVDGFLNKPVEAADLLREVSRLVGK